MTRAAILEPSSGIAGDMMLGALLDLGVEEAWLHGLPAELGLDGVTVKTARVIRGEISCAKVDFEIPPQPHGRHLRHIRTIVEASRAPDDVKARAMHAFELLTAAEAAVHGTTIEKVHLHEVGAVDAILDVVGSVWGLQRLGVEVVHCTPIALGDGFVEAAHGRMAVPAPAVVRLLEGFDVVPGPDGSGELTTPTGAALVQALATRGTPPTYRPIRAGYGAGTRQFAGRSNALRVTLADVDAAAAQSETVVLLACDIDDMEGEYIAGAASAFRAVGALDVTLIPVLMKKGRPGTRLEVLCRPTDADRLESEIFSRTSTIGVRRTASTRTALPRESRTVSVLGHSLNVKVAALPDGGRRVKPEFDDVARVAEATGKSLAEVRDLALEAALRE